MAMDILIWSAATAAGVSALALVGLFVFLLTAFVAATRDVMRDRKDKRAFRSVIRGARKGENG